MPSTTTDSRGTRGARSGKAAGTIHLQGAGGVNIVIQAQGNATITVHAPRATAVKPRRSPQSGQSA